MQRWGMIQLYLSDIISKTQSQTGNMDHEDKNEWLTVFEKEKKNCDLMQ